MTLSIIARCARTGQFGVAAATEMPAVGKLLAYAWPGAGAVATQAQINPYLGIDGIALLREGVPAASVVERVLSGDPGARTRQLAVVDRLGVVAGWTGEACPAWSGAIKGQGFSVQGNRLDGPEVLEAMAAAYRAMPAADLADRLVSVIHAGVRAGGDRLGERSASVLVADREDYPLWDIRVDDHDHPENELSRLHGVFRRELLPHIVRMPSRACPGGKDEDFTV